MTRTIETRKPSPWRWLVTAAIAGATLCATAQADVGASGADALPPPPAAREAAAQGGPAARQAPPVVAMATPQLPTSPSRRPPPPPPRADADEPFWLGDIAPKLKIEARLDGGDVAENAAGTAWQTGNDAYLKKVRFGVGGRLLARGKYSVLAIVENVGRDGKDAETKLDRAYVEYAFARALVVRGGKAKLPLSRGSLMSSNDVFLRDPAVVDAIDDVFVDDTQWNLQLRGSVGAGVLSWAGAVAPGWQQGDPIHKTTGASAVASAEPLLVGRVELAVPGFSQALEDTGPGRGRRISLGGSYARQRGIAYVGGAGTEDRTLASVDLTMRLGMFSAVAEADGWMVESTLPAVGRKTPVGGYGQLAWFIPAVRLEPSVRYEAYWEKAEAGADQETLSLGLNWYARMDHLKVAAELMRTEYGPLSSGRLDAASERTRLQLGVDFSF